MVKNWFDWSSRSRFQRTICVYSSWSSSQRGVQRKRSQRHLEKTITLLESGKRFLSITTRKWYSRTRMNSKEKWSITTVFPLPAEQTRLEDYLEEVFKTVLPKDNSEEIPNLRSLIVSGTLLVDDDKCNICMNWASWCIHRPCTHLWLSNSVHRVWINSEGVE